MELNGCKTKQDCRDRIEELRDRIERQKEMLEEVDEARREVLREHGRQYYNHMASVDGLPGNPEFHREQIDRLRYAIEETQRKMDSLPR